MRKGCSRRLDAIAESISRESTALALLGLGSVGIETDRLDQFSDLDFFVIVETGHQEDYLESLDWLSRVQLVAYSFRNTVDGFKALSEDGVFCEFAVFEPHQLESAAYPPGRIVWSVDTFDTTLAPRRTPPPTPRTRDADFLVGEAGTNLYVGLLRDHRGETMAAFLASRCMQ